MKKTLNNKGSRLMKRIADSLAKRRALESEGTDGGSEKGEPRESRERGDWYGFLLGARHGTGEKGRTLYLERLKKQGLPLQRVARRSAPAKQFQVAQLAAMLSIHGGAKRSAPELAGRAMRLWNAAGRALWVEEQTRIVSKGILFFDQDDWRMHAHDLSRAFEDGPMAPFWTGDIDRVVELGAQEFLASTRRAGVAVEEAWDRLRPRVWPEDVLRVLFPGKGETDRTRLEKFFRLVDYINAFLEKDAARHGAEYKKMGVDVLGFWIAQAWAPLGFDSNKREVEITRLTKKRLAAPEEFLVWLCLCAFPAVVRFFVLFRLKQAAEAKVRR